MTDDPDHDLPGPAFCWLVLAATALIFSVAGFAVFA